MSPARLSSIRSHIRGTAAVETALILPILLPMLLGGMELGMIMWTRNTLQSVAAITARCAAIGSPDCTNPSSYAVTLANKWLNSTKITATNVSINTAGTCSTGSPVVAVVPGVVVAITPSAWTGHVMHPFMPSTTKLTACYPK